MDFPRPSHFRRVWLLGFLLVPLHADTDPLEVGEKAASEWIKVRLETDRIENAWTSERPLLESTINGLKDRADALEDKRDHVKAKTAKDREEIAAMQEKNQAADDDLHATEERLQALSAKLLELRPALPPRLSEALELSYRSLAGSGLAAGERMRLSMTMLGRIMQFNRTVTYGDEVLAMGGEQGARSMEVIYWGLSHGYAFDRTEGKAWYGSPGPQGWQWEPRPDSTRAVAALIAIYNDKADPDFVEVPASLGHAGAEDTRR
jgi:hypothetical protein